MTESPPTEDPALSRLYRTAADAAPPPALDAAILAAARASVAPRLAVKSTWWQRLRLPMSVAATVMLTVMLALTMQQNPPEVAEVTAPRPTPSESVPTAAPSSAQPAEKGRAKEAVTAGEAHAPTLVPATPATPAAATARSFPALPAEKKAIPATPLPPLVRDGASSGATEGRAVAADSAADTAAKAERSESARERGTLALPAPAAAPAGAQLNSAAKRAQPLGEAAWLDEIRALRRQGRHEDAARRLAEFRTVYPDYPLPDDLK